MGTWQTAAARRQHELDEFAPLPAHLAKAVSYQRKGDLELRRAVLLAFCDPLPEQCSLLLELSSKQWRKMLPWLDTSGLALYLFDRLADLQLLDALPEQVRSRLAENLADNTLRMRSLAAETMEIHREFHHAGVSHAVLKGISFWPHSVPKLELRSQLDLDFLVAEAAAREARQILERRGYHLHAISGRSWEFKTGPLPPASLKSLYKAVPHRSVELHIEGATGSLLVRTQTRGFLGADLPVLAPPDLLLGQGLHLFKHYMSEFSRAAHLLEFRRHVLAHRNDLALWSELHARAKGNPSTAQALGVVTLLITSLMGAFAPDSLSSWTVASLPKSAKLWLEMHGARTALASFPGNKLYLLLQAELEAEGLHSRRPIRRALLPLRLPPPIAHAPERETLSTRLLRQSLQLRFILFRLRFHAVAGFQYFRERLRWRKARQNNAMTIR